MYTCHGQIQGVSGLWLDVLLYGTWLNAFGTTDFPLFALSTVFYFLKRLPDISKMVIFKQKLLQLLGSSFSWTPLATYILQTFSFRHFFLKS